LASAGVDYIAVIEQPGPASSATLTIRDVDVRLKDALRVAPPGATHSKEAELRDILRRALRRRRLNSTWLKTSAAGPLRLTLAAAATAVFAQDFAGRVLPFDGMAAEHYADIRAARRRAGKPMETFHAQIAAIALAAGATATMARAAIRCHTSYRAQAPATVSPSTRTVGASVPRLNTRSSAGVRFSSMSRRFPATVISLTGSARAPSRMMKPAAPRL
jgi:plasmid stability protein